MIRKVRDLILAGILAVTAYCAPDFDKLRGTGGVEVNPDAPAKVYRDGQVDAPPSDAYLPDASLSDVSQLTPDIGSDIGSLPDGPTHPSDGNIPDLGLDARVAYDAPLPDAPLPIPDLGPDSAIPLDGPSPPPDVVFSDASLDGLVSDATISDATIPPDAGVDSSIIIGPWRKISAAIWHSCALRIDNSARCWGAREHDYGQTPSFLAGPYDNVSAGRKHTLLLRGDGSAQCWGDNTEGQCNDSPGDPERCAPCELSGPYSHASAGGNQSCFLRRSDRSIKCVGNNDYRQIDDVPSGSFDSISAEGTYHVCALVSGLVSCWGNDTDRQASPPAETFTQIDVGTDNGCGVKTDDQVQCWGRDREGQSTPPEDENFTKVSSGLEHSCGLKLDRTARCWGNNGGGRAPRSYSGHFASASAGGEHTLLLTDNGYIVCLGGREEEGQCDVPD